MKRLILVGSLVLVFLVGCAGTARKVDLAQEIYKPSPGNEREPAWVTDSRTVYESPDGKKVFARGKGKSRDLQKAIDNASADARWNLARHMVQEIFTETYDSIKSQELPTQIYKPSVPDRPRALSIGDTQLEFDLWFSRICRSNIEVDEGGTYTVYSLICMDKKWYEANQTAAAYSVLSSVAFSKGVKLEGLEFFFFEREKGQIEVSCSAVGSRAEVGRTKIATLKGDGAGLRKEAIRTAIASFAEELDKNFPPS